MNPDLLLPAALALVVVLVLALLAVLLRDRARVHAELAATRAEAAELRDRIDALAQQVVASRREPEEFVITHLGEPEADAAQQGALTEDQRIDGRLFADLVLRETVVKAASLAYGVRRALDPEARNRVWFEMKREVRRARKQRKADTREARREWAARQRAADSAA